MSGAVAEGEGLPREAELAKEFSVSRQAVREALKVLAAKGLVASRRRTGTSVLPRASWNLLDPDVLAWTPPDNIQPAFFADLIELRRVIEPAAAEMAARRADQERLARLKTALEAMRAGAEDVKAFLEADAEFHVALLSASGNSLFERLSTIIQPVLEASFILQAQVDPKYHLAVGRHEAVYEAVAHGDAEAARRAMEDILSSAQDHLAKLIRDRAAKNDA